MILNMSKLNNVKGNKYALTKGTLLAIDRLGNIKDYPADSRGWKVVPNVLNMVLNGQIKFHRVASEETPKED